MRKLQGIVTIPDVKYTSPLKLELFLDPLRLMISIGSELDALRMELERSRDECSMHKQELEAMQVLISFCKHSLSTLEDHSYLIPKISNGQ